MRKKGISLILLVITIIVIIILAGAVLLAIASNNPVTGANKATFLSDVRTFQTDLDLHHTKQFTDTLGNYNFELLQADLTSVTYGEDVDSTKTINDVIRTLGRTPKYAGVFKVVDGRLVYTGTNDNQKIWAHEAGLEVLDENEPVITFIPPDINVVLSGTNVIYTLRFTSNIPITSVDLTDKIQITDNAGTPLEIQPNVIIGSVSGTSTDVLREVEITIATDALVDEAYKVKVLAGAVTNANGFTNTIDILSPIGFDVSNTPPTNPVVSSSAEGWTNGNVTVTINYSADSTTKLYSFDSVTWLDYTSPITVTSNTTIYAKGLKITGVESGVSVVDVLTIDKTAPTVSAVNGGTTTSSITLNVNATDGESGINTSSYQYSRDNGSTWTAASSNTSHTFTGLTTGTYQCRVRVSDIAGNTSTSDSISITTQGLGTITFTPSTTEWTNQNVNVTINYPTEATVKQYSLNDGSTWLSYTTEVVMTSNGTILAKGEDAGGNQIAQASITIDKIDKQAPNSVTFSPTSGAGEPLYDVTITLNDIGLSGVNTTEYIIAEQNTTTPTSGWVPFTNGATVTITAQATGTYYIWVRGTDNAGNIQQGLVSSGTYTITGPKVVKVSSGPNHNLLLMSNGEVYAWGDNWSGKLGDGTVTNRSIPVKVVGLENIVDIAAGGHHSLALTSSGGVKAWGYNIQGQLGDGTVTDRHTPVDVVGLTSGVSKVIGGHFFSAALTTGGGIKTWGQNTNGQLGIGTTGSYTSDPRDVIGLTSGVSKVIGGGYHMLALLDNGGVKSWGDNTEGQLGIGSTTARNTPGDVQGLTSGVSDIAAGYKYSLALTTAGAVKSWGANGSGQLGDGTTTRSTLPIDVAGLSSGITQISSRYTSSLALTTGGGIKVWGSNDSGQLGDGTGDDKYTPVDVIGLTSGVKQISAGWWHSLALMIDGEVKSWGANGSGQLGDGTTTGKNTAVNVLIP